MRAGIGVGSEFRGCSWCLGFRQILFGSRAETEGHILEAFRLSPRDTDAYRWMRFVGVAKLQLAADVEAVGWLRRSVEANRNHPLAHFSLAAALGLIGALDEARTAAKAGLGRERVCEGMRLAGVPEG